MIEMMFKVTRKYQLPDIGTVVERLRENAERKGMQADISPLSSFSVNAPGNNSTIYVIMFNGSKATINFNPDASRLDKEGLDLCVRGGNENQVYEELSGILGVNMPYSPEAKSDKKNGPISSVNL